MLIPLGTDRPLRRPTLVAPALVAATVAVYFLQVLIERTDPGRWEWIASFLVLNPAELRPWAFITYAFLHGGLMHLLGNMVFLWVFGPNVEDRLGRIGFLVFYLLGAAGAGGLHALFDQHPVVGASGAIAAVTGAYLVLFPHTAIRTLVFFFFIGVFAIPAWWFIGAQIAMNVWLQASGRGGNVAVLAHLGGYAFGAGTAMILLATHVLSREPYDLFTISRQAARRRQFRELTHQRGRTLRQDRRPDSPVARGGPAAPAVPEAVLHARAEITTLLAENKPAEAAAAYRRLLERHGAAPAVALLSRRAQYDVANALFAAGDHSTAATAYELFLQAYPSDTETPMVRLMLGLINARYLNDPVKAKREIAQVRDDLPPGEPRELADQLLAELG